MTERLPLTDEEGEVRELTEEDVLEFSPASEFLPTHMAPEIASKLLRPLGRPKANTTKEHVNIRLDPDIVAAFKATGRGWQTRLNEALREWLKVHSKVSES